MNFKENIVTVAMTLVFSAFVFGITFYFWGRSQQDPDNAKLALTFINPLKGEVVKGESCSNRKTFFIAITRTNIFVLAVSFPGYTVVILHFYLIILCFNFG